MEKYSKWRDQKSGIHPFIPAKTKISDAGVISYLKWWILGPILAILRIPFVIIILLWALVMTLVSAIIPIPIAKRFFIRYTQAMGFRVLLFLLGFYWIQTRYVKLGRSTRIPKNSAGSDVKAGDVIICNHSSYIDVFFLAFRFSPVFTVVPNTWTDQPPKGVVAKTRNLFGALWDAIVEPSYSYSPDNAIPLKQVIQQAKAQGAPVVIFPEGCTSNGKTFLSCVPVLDGVDIAPSSIHLVGLKYDYEDFSPCYSVGNFLFHFFQMCCQIYNSLEVRYLPTEDIPSSDQAFPVGEDPQEVEGSWGDKVCGMVGSVLRIKSARLTAKDKREFKDYWYGHKKAYKKD